MHGGQRKAHGSCGLPLNMDAGPGIPMVLARLPESHPLPVSWPPGR